MRNGGELKLITGNANPKLAEEIAKDLGIPMGKAQTGRFSDGEIEVKILDNVRGTDCFVVQPTCPPVNENLMELLIIIDALRRSSARRITAVMPYYGYGRADRKVEPRVPITAKLVANLITAAGANRVLAMDLHAGQIQGFFDIPVDHLYGTPVFLDHIERMNLKKVVVVSPDTGGVERARAFAKRLGSAGLAIIDKRRPRPNEADIMNVIGDVEGSVCIILDDLVDTAGTVCKVAQALQGKGATRVLCACSHAVLSGEAIQRIEASPIEQLIITNTVALNGKKSKKFVVLSVAKLFAESIRRIHNDESLSALFV